MTSELKAFLDHFARSLREGDAAVFAGAGLSNPAGYVNWKELLREIATELGLDVDRETDLVAVAQYHVNTQASRARLNRLLIEEFTKDARPTRNHELIASIPLRTVWTTNYDTLIEDAYKEAGRRPDVKRSVEDLARSVPGRQATIYKMHGDISRPQDAILTKDDYETYDFRRELFSTALKGDLVSKTFLFLGFSFTDPNIDYILSRVRSLLGQNQREHYCVLRRVPASTATGADRAQAEYEARRQALRIADLKRYSIRALLIDDYTEVETVLSILARVSHNRNMLVSGSAEEFSVWSRDRTERFLRRLGIEIIRRGYNLVSGMGLGIGAAVLSGAMESIYRDARATASERLTLRPFPGAATEAKAPEYTLYRKEMLREAGCAVFVAGNKSDPETGEIVEADGVIEEFRIAQELNVCPIPIGASGYAAKTIWNEVSEAPGRFYPGHDVAEEMAVLGDPGSSEDQLVEAVFRIAERLRA